MMSGTSLDGLDMALCAFEASNNAWGYEILETDFRAYSDEMRTRLEGAIELPATDLLVFHASYGQWLGRQAREFLKKTGADVDAIASHGHTVHHRPEKGFTFQLGAPQEIALISGCRTIGDFRSLDVALGGQGAPLVPVGDRLLFGEYQFCLNLGGICNVSFERGGKRMAYDIGLANMLLNYLCKPLGIPYDKDGRHARRGTLNKELLGALDNLPYYHLPFPKSTGFEWFLSEVIPILDDCPDTPENKLHTAVWHIAGQIHKQLDKLKGDPHSTVLITGGGAYNSYLIEVLQGLLGNTTEILVPESELISFKEALVFAFLGALRLHGTNNVLASVTGAERDSCSGVVFLP
jgi:anhydro-N-acetylmuramic acid kinase